MSKIINGIVKDLKTIPEKFKAKTGNIDKKKLVLAEPIKNVGTFTVPVKLHPKVTAELKVKVEGI